MDGREESTDVARSSRLSWSALSSGGGEEGSIGIGGNFLRRYIEALEVSSDMLLPEAVQCAFEFK